MNRDQTQTIKHLPVQLDVLSRSSEQVEESVDDLVLADTLVTDEEKVIPVEEISQHVLHNFQVLIGANKYKIRQFNTNDNNRSHRLLLLL